VAKSSLRCAGIAMMRMLPCIFVLSCSAIALAQSENDALFTARSLLQQGKNNEAITWLKAVAARQPNLRGVNHELGVAYYREAQYLEASNYLQDALNENEEDRDAAQLLGLSYYFSGRPVQAIAALEKVRSWRPNSNIDALYILGICYTVAERRDEARQIFSQLYGVNPNSAAAHLLLARMLLRQGFDPSAESEARAALLISPQLPVAHLTLGELGLYGGDYSKAVQEFNAELAVNPTSAAALTRLGDVYWRLNQGERSKKILLRSIGIDPAAPESYVLLGKVLFRDGQIALAEQNFHHATDLDPGSYTAHYFLGQVYREQGRSEAAQREMLLAARIQQSQTANAARK